MTREKVIEQDEIDYKLKKNEILDALKSGELKRVGRSTRAWSVPSRFFVLGITPTMIEEVVKGEKND